MATRKAVRKQRPLRVPHADPANLPAGLSFPIVAIGASAGGLAAFTSLLKNLPAKSGMGFVLIQHLEPKHESALSTLLSKATRMPVVEVTNGMTVEPDRVYVIPPNKGMTIHSGTLRLAPRGDTGGMQRPIDDFAIALAEEQGNRAIGVVLSGTGSDGTYGLKSIKAAGGVTFAQDPKTAQWPAMPMSAITAGSVDFVLSPKRIAAELARIGRHPYVAETREISDGSDLDKICIILRSATGVDFRLYKQATVRRRISRRMALLKIASLNKYLQTLRNRREEAPALADDIFIHVTSFFRDPESFEVLRKRVLSKLFGKKSADKRPEDEPLRIWIAGCSTGEEVYSIAMLLMEELGERANRTRIQIFGTDVQERALEHARSGVYSESAVAGVSRARLKRFFKCGDHGYQILKSIRDLCVFARHDLTRAPPFSRLELITCRNVLIYMGPSLQKRILSTFQYALKPGGFLFLGTSESVSDYSEAFTAIDAKHRIFARKPPAALYRELPSAPAGLPEHGVALVRTPAPPAALDFRKEAEAALLDHYTPAALIVDPDLHIVHFQGNTSPYLAPATGQPSFHLLKMVRPEFVIDLRTAISKARKDGAAVHRDSVEFYHEGRLSGVRLEVRPLPKRNGRKQNLLIVFQRAEPAREEMRGSGVKRGAEKPGRLERELVSTRDHLRSLIAEHETAQEEMKAANEEILSSNEELQSTNEELETAKEELQSSNEELVTLNDELQHRNTELNVLMHDLSNLLVGVDIPVLVLDADLRVRRFTPVAGALLNLIAGDVGRPFSNIASTLDVPDWRELLLNVTVNGKAVEREVTDRNGHRYSMRVRPYKTDDNKIEGVLIVMLDTDMIYQARDEAKKAGDYARAIVETIREALAVVDPEFRIVTVNGRFCELFKVTPEEMQGKSFVGRAPGQCDAPRLRSLLGNVLSNGAELKNLEVDQDFPRVGSRRLVMDVGRIAGTRNILIAIEDATIRKEAREELEKSESTIRALLDSSTQSVITVNDAGNIVTGNARTEQMFGYPVNELVGRPVDILLSERTRKEYGRHHRAYLSEVLSKRKGFDLSLEGRHRDGTSFPIDVSLGVVDTASGKLTVAFMSDISHRRQLEKTAQTHAAQVQALAARLLTAQEEERRRVSRELHDQICQQLASLAIDIGSFAASPRPAAKQRERRLKELQERVVEASEATRHIAYQLHPSVLDDLGLVASLRALCKKFSEREGIEVQFQHSALPSAVPRETGSCLYRVAQESLQNIASHSGAKKASVTLSLKDQSIVLDIVDDGTGFDLEAARGRGGLGLVGMEERARLVNGELSVVARPGDGSSISLQVPLSDGSL